ncbi:hypothetical protein ACSQ67_020049 [Phaseolus vulgaris]
MGARMAVCESYAILTAKPSSTDTKRQVVVGPPQPLLNLDTQLSKAYLMVGFEVTVTEAKSMALQFLLLLLAVAAHGLASNATLNETCGYFDASLSRDTNVPCPIGWVMAPNKTKCFLHVGRPQSWNDSETCCSKYGGHLASLTSLQELQFAQSLCGESVNSCWIGGQRFNTTAGYQWMWSDNSPGNNSIFPLEDVFPHCNGTELSCHKNSTDNLCTVMTNNSNSLMSERCDNPHSSLCILDIGASLPSWKVFTKEELRSITKNFSEGNRLVGDTKTGGTYSGVLSDGSRVAVKRLKRTSFQRKKEFYSEISRVARLRYPNLVAVMGCCYDHGDRYIVYEFVANGPLDKWLHHIPRGGRSLDWAMRMKIATTLAQGIAFLHDKVKPQVVHRDIRASNVLLDEEFGARLMGVGLSKIVPYEVMHERTVMAGGTSGYLAPEFVYRNEFTTKSDVYSFGVLLLEIVSGRRPTQAVDSVGWQSIFEWATPLVQVHRYHELLDPHITSSSSSIIPEASTIQKVVDLVYSCTQHVPSMRPRMSHVVHQLQQIAQPPAK